MLELSKLQAYSPQIQISELPAFNEMQMDNLTFNDEHIEKANAIYARMLPLLIDTFGQNPSQRAVVSMSGTADAGRREIAHLVCHYLNEARCGAHKFSGENYSHRSPFFNEAERLRVFRTAGIRGLLSANSYSDGHAQALDLLTMNDEEANPDVISVHPWMSAYQKAGRAALKQYLGTQSEVDFQELSSVLEQFRNGSDEIYFRRMPSKGNFPMYDRIDLRNTHVLILESIYGNSDLLTGVHIPVYLQSTPQKITGGTSISHFHAVVIETEQTLIHSQGRRAKITV